jgi:hypothetical protein
VPQDYRFQWTQSARRHRIGKAHVQHVVATVEPAEGVRPTGEVELTWVGRDDRGVTLTVMGVVLEPDVVLIFHVMPVYRGEE